MALLSYSCRQKKKSLCVPGVKQEHDSWSYLLILSRQSSSSHFFLLLSHNIALTIHRKLPLQHLHSRYFDLFGHQPLYFNILFSQYRELSFDHHQGHLAMKVLLMNFYWTVASIIYYQNWCGVYSRNWHQQSVHTHLWYLKIQKKTTFALPLICCLFCHWYFVCLFAWFLAGLTVFLILKLLLVSLQKEC